MTNNTITNNSAAIGGGICCWGDSNPTLTNTILWGNTAGGDGDQVALLQRNCDPFLYYCNVQGGMTAFKGWGADPNYDTSRYQDNIDADPLFASPSGGSGTGSDGLAADWSLLAGSPCIDKGGLPDSLSLPLRIWWTTQESAGTSGLMNT